MGSEMKLSVLIATLCWWMEFGFFFGNQHRWKCGKIPCHLNECENFAPAHARHAVEFSTIFIISWAFFIIYSFSGNHFSRPIDVTSSPVLAISISRRWNSSSFTRGCVIIIFWTLHEIPVWIPNWNLFHENISRTCLHNNGTWEWHSSHKIPT